MLEGRRSWLFQRKQRANLSFLSFCSIQSLNGLDDFYPIGEGKPLHSVYSIKHLSLSLSNINPKIIFYLALWAAPL